MIYPDNDKTKKPLLLYCELDNPELLQRRMEELLLDYNSVNISHMDIVMFSSAIEHIVQINRTISLPFGHLLLVGVSGTGRKTSAILASYLAGF